MYIEPWDLDDVARDPHNCGGCEHCFRVLGGQEPETFVAELEDFEPLADYASGQPGVNDLYRVEYLGTFGKGA